MTTMNEKSTLPRRATLGLAGAAAIMGIVQFAPLAGAAQEARVIPAYQGDANAASSASEEVAILAGGCFWGVQGVFQHVKGVTGAVSGYAGGEKQTAKYELIGSGKTGHAEAVRVTYDPTQISYAQLLHIFFSVAHDPTQLNRQGPDRGTQYRSAVFPTTPEQAAIASAYIGQLDKARAFKTAIVTKIELSRPFYPAEAYHQDFMTKNPRHPYIVVHDLPKVEDLKRIFADAYRETPVLVASAPAKR